MSRGQAKRLVQEKYNLRQLQLVGYLTFFARTYDADKVCEDSHCT